MFCCGSIAGYINGFSVAECQYIARAFIYIVHTVKTSFHRLDRYIAEIKGLMHAVNYSFLPCDDPTIRISVFYLIGCVVVKVSMSHKNQVCREIVIIACVRINIDHLSFRRNDTDTCLSLIDQRRCTCFAFHFFILLLCRVGML